jgi:DNA topoisomerase/DEAD/DEAH box helicase
VLLKRGYIVRSGKSLEATDKGIRLIEIVHAEVRSPAMTGQWESYLKRIQRGTASLEPFVKGIEDYVREVVGKVGKTPLAMKAAMAAGAGDPKGLRVRPEPVTTVPERTSESLVGLLHSAFGFSSFRPNQEAVCRAAVEGKDVLLVMPTGSGKSLCYQLPGIARVYKPESRKIPVSFERVQSRRKLGRSGRRTRIQCRVAQHSAVSLVSGPGAGGLSSQPPSSPDGRGRMLHEGLVPALRFCAPLSSYSAFATARNSRQVW